MTKVNKSMQNIKSIPESVLINIIYSTFAFKPKKPYNMQSIILKRINSLREFMSANHINAFIIPNTEPHLSEYIAPHWKCRQWISGFTGSAGTIVITESQAGLWTDSRYFLQASQQLMGTNIELFKEGLSETPTIIQWLCSTLKSGDCVGVNGGLFSVSSVKTILSELSRYNILLDTTYDPFSSLWNDRPAIPETPIYIHPLEYAGQHALDKIAQIRKEIRKNEAEGILLSALDEIAWTLNLRGNDIKYNPVVISHLIISQEDIIYFINPKKVTAEVSNYLQKLGVHCMHYNQLSEYLSTCKLHSLQLMPSTINYGAYSAIAPTCRIIQADSPVSLMKSMKNEQEIEGIHNAMVRDGIAMSQFLCWLEKAIHTGKETELSITQKLHDFRSKQDLFKGESFDTIMGYKEHAAIVHYSATEESNITLRPEGMLLVDSGAQYSDATTDITRTIALGPLTEEEKFDYTAVLKGHINLALCQFPKGTRGAQVDILARKTLWNAGMNYLHGTGHGVGSFLNVHEGPQSIRMNENPICLEIGMLTSNEPGLYKSGRHGIRIENLMLVRKGQETEFGTFYRFETVTLCPIDKTAINQSMLTVEEKNWLNEYHQMVFDKLSPYLTEEENNWLKEKTSAI